MTRFWLVRHGSHDWLGKVLVGRTPGIRLNPIGQGEARIVADTLAHVPLSVIYSSPLERARETAAPIAASRGLNLQAHEALNEIDFGEWTNSPFEALNLDSRWHRWNSRRASSTTPGGESMQAVQERIICFLEDLARQNTGKDIAIVSHGDVIRAALCRFLGVSLNAIHNVEIGPGGIAVLDLFPKAAALRVLLSNHALLRCNPLKISRLSEKECGFDVESLSRPYVNDSAAA